MFSKFRKDDITKNGTDVISSNLLNGNVEDLEDFGRKKGSSTSSPRPVARHYEGNGERDQVKGTCNPNDCPYQDMPTEDIDKNVDYQGWLEIKKRKWREVLDQRKRRRYAQNPDTVPSHICLYVMNFSK